MARNWLIDKRTTGGFALALAVLAGTGVLSYLDFLNYRKIEAGLRNTYKVLKTNQELINLVTDAETGQRGYLLTKASRYLEPYRTAIKRLDPEIKQLRQLTADNPSQQQRVDALKPLLVAKLAELQQTIDLRSTSLEVALQVVNTDRGQQLMQQIRKLSEEIAIAENQLSQSYLHQEQTHAQIMTLVIVLGSSVVFGLITVAGVLANRELKERKQAQEALKQREEHFRLMVESVKEYAIFILASSGHVISWNPGAECLNGYQASEIIGKHSSSFNQEEDIQRGKPKQ